MRKTGSRVILKKVDIFIIGIIIVMLVSSPVIIVYSKSKLSQSNISLEKMKNKIEKQETINESISMKINELASLTNIQEIAKEQGLSYQNDNIVVVK